MLDFPLNGAYEQSFEIKFPKLIVASNSHVRGRQRGGEGGGGTFRL